MQVNRLNTIYSNCSRNYLHIECLKTRCVTSLKNYEKIPLYLHSCI